MKTTTFLTLLLTLLPRLVLAEPVDMPQRAQELKQLKWGMFICWSFSTFSGKEWTPGVKEIWQAPGHRRADPAPGRRDD
jgi:hypothetical protein